jgi:hypothetical protein
MAAAHFRTAIFPQFQRLHHPGAFRALALSAT